MRRGPNLLTNLKLHFGIGSLLVLAHAAGCDANQSGNVRARAIGAQADEPAPRVAAMDVELIDACGEGGATGSSPFIRYPYLQQITQDSAKVLWGSSDSRSYDVTVTSPDGAQVGKFESQLDTTGAVSDGGHLQVAALSGLAPNSVYCYAIEGSQGQVLAPTGFRTAPAPGTPISFAVLGDSGEGGADQLAVLKQLETVPAQLLLATGDIAYDSGTLQEFEDNFFSIYEPLLASIPMFPTSGNHEYETADAAPYRAVFALPENGGDAGRERWYSFDWSDVHFVALDTERASQAQADWLEADLARNRLPWTIAIAHKGPYSSGEHGSNQEFRGLFSPILSAHGVQLVFTGHDHNYERSKAMDGVTYVVTGGGGKGTRAVGRSAFTEFSIDVLHFVYVTVDGDELRLHAIDATGQEFDFARIRRVSREG